MTRTTLNLDPSVLRAAKRRAKEEGKSLGQVISELAAPALATPRSVRARQAFRWSTSQMGPARIDLQDKEAVRQALDRE